VASSPAAAALFSPTLLMRLIQSATQLIICFQEAPFSTGDSLSPVRFPVCGIRKDSIELNLQLRLAIAFLDDRQFPFQNHAQEVPVAASGFQKAGVDPLRFLLHQIEHGIDLSLSRQHLAMIRDPLFRYDLFYIGPFLA
jgi:hypothetical protein